MKWGGVGEKPQARWKVKKFGGPWKAKKFQKETVVSSILQKTNDSCPLHLISGRIKKGTLSYYYIFYGLSNIKKVYLFIFGRQILPEDGFRLLVAGECPVGDRFLVLEASAVEAEVNFRAFRLIRWGPTMASNEVSHCWKATSLSAW